jgi:hypothetical protein
MRDDIFRLVVQIKIYACSILVILGCIGSFVSLLVFINAKNKLPKISERKYLITFSISNMLFLLLNWYILTLPSILVYYEVNNESFFEKYYILNANIYACKIMNYLTSTARCFTILITLTLTLDRAFATYFPLKLINLKQANRSSSKYVIKLIALVSFLLPIYVLINYDLIEAPSDQRKSSESKSQDFKVCSINSINDSTHIMFTIMYMLFSMGIPFLIIIFTNLAIILKLRNYKIKVTRYCLNKEQKIQYDRLSLMSPTRKEPFNDPNFLVFNEFYIKANAKEFQENVEARADCGNNFRTSYSSGSLHSANPSASAIKTNSDIFLKIALNSECILLNKKDGSITFYSKSNKKVFNQIENLTTNNINSSVANNSRKLSLTQESNKIIKINYFNQKLHNTKMLVVLSTFFVIFNLPYLIQFYISLVPYYDQYNSDLSLKERIDLQYKFHTYLSIAEILYVSNYSLNGLLLFSSGKIFRIHLWRLLKCQN